MTNYRETIERTVEERVEGYKDIALQIHDKPEVSNYEFFACEILSNKLVEEGFEVKVYEEVLNTYGEQFTPRDIYKAGGSIPVWE